MLLKYYFNTILIVGIFAISAVGYLVYKKKFKNEVNRSWFYFSMCASAWALFYLLTINSGVKENALIFINLVNLAGILVILFWFNFVTKFLGIYKKYKLFIFLLSILAFLIYLSSFGNWFVVDMVPKYIFSYYVVPGTGYLFLVLYFFFVGFYGLKLLFSHFRKSTGVFASQVKYILLSSALGFIGGGSVFALAYDIPFPPYLLILWMFFPLVIAYAIIKYRLMGIRVIASKIYFYTIISLFSYLFFYIVVFLDNNYLGGIYAPLALGAGLLFATLFSLLFLPLLNKVQKSSDILFFKGYNPQSLLKDLGLKLSTVINLNQVINTIKQELKKILATEEIGVIIFPVQNDGDSRNICYSMEPFRRFCINPKDKIYGDLLKKKSITIFEEVPKNEFVELKSELSEHNIKVFAPLVFRAKVIGVVILGEKIDQDAYTKEDLDFLEVIMPQLAVAIENARLYKEVKDFSKVLQKKVDEQTADIREKSDRLKRLVAMKSEFLDIASHQLRTPISVIKGTLSMLMSKSVPKNKISSFYIAAFQKSLKLEEVIDEILRASEMESDRFELDVRPTDINPILHEVYTDKENVAKEKKIELVLNMPKEGLPLVQSDPKYIKHVFYNLLNNAFQYTLKGRITIDASVVKDKVVVKVSDTGIGIPENEMGKIFKKFSRASNAIRTYTDGSGLGLHIIKRIMEAHPGGKAYLVKTEVDKGTEFAVEIPVGKQTK